MWKKTAQEIQDLKDQWCEDPIWDLEETEWFEDYKNDLFAFSVAKKAEWEREQKKIDEIKVRVFLNEGTEIDIKSTKQQLRELIRESAEKEKNGIKDNFVEVYCERMFWKNWDVKLIGKNLDLYTKRILFFYEI